MTADVEDVQMDSQELQLEPGMAQVIEQATPPSDVFMAPSVDKANMLAGTSYSHFSAIPQRIADDMATECVLGVDEAGRGPVLGMQPFHPSSTSHQLTAQAPWSTPSSTCLSTCTTRY
jgi:ribonuclease H2 subunit A